MALNSSGPISLAGTTAGQSIELENGGNGTTQISLNDTPVRNLAGVPSGTIVMPTNFWGKSNVVNISYTFSATTADASLNLSSISGYSAGNSNITVTINSGVYLYATSTGSYGLNLSGGTTGDTLTIVNNGFIIGKGGNAPYPAGSSQNGNYGGNNGGPALNLGFAMSSCTINNTNGSAYIAGGGGSGTSGSVAGYQAGGGGGAGGGNGYNFANGVVPGAGPGQTASVGVDMNVNQPVSQPGGRVLPGTGGYATRSGYPSTWSEVRAGAGGFGFNNDSNSGIIYGGPQGSGAGGSGSSNAPNAGQYSGKGAGGSGGGGWGARGGYNPNYGTYGGNGGKAVNTNGKSITWTSGDTSRVYGSVS